MIRWLWVTLVVIAGFSGGGAKAAPDANRCVECHQRAETVKALPSWYQDQFVHWYGSVHGKAGVTCERCHEGTPAQPDKKRAHEGVRPAGDPKSPIYYQNLPETCGACHKKAYQHFTQTRHYTNLKADRLAPTCTTCHGFQMDIRGISLPHLVGRCTLCHNPKQGVKPEVADQAREAFEGIVHAEEEIEKTDGVIDFAREKGGQTKEAEKLLSQARDRLRRTGDLWHDFRLGAFKQELREIEAMVKAAHEGAVQGILKRPSKDGKE